MKFLTSYVDKSDPIPHLRSSLDKGFGYHIYEEDNVRQAELDDLKSRCVEVEQASDFYKHQDRKVPSQDLVQRPVGQAVHVQDDEAQNHSGHRHHDRQEGISRIFSQDDGRFRNRTRREIGQCFSLEFLRTNRCSKKESENKDEKLEVKDHDDV